MPARAAARTGAARRSTKRKTADVEQVPPEAGVAADSEAEDWADADASRARLEEGEMEILLTGHAASHGIEGEDNWLIETEEVSWGEQR
jgi:hypothetical protein